MRYLVIIFLFSFVHTSFAQSAQQFINMGDFQTVEGDVIKDCTLGYRTVGTLNSDKTNAVLWTTWFTGSSEEILGTVNNVMDTTGLYVIIVDALTNGISSSPSNTEDFPRVSIRDMVNSQYKLLTDHLDIKHLYALMGISMGGMQTFEWIVAYPEFMDKAISINGTPKQSSIDLLIWQTMADILTTAEQNGQDLNIALKHAGNIALINLYTPAYVVNNYPADSVQAYIGQGLKMHPLDVLGGLKAMISQDIYKTSKSDFDTIDTLIETELLVLIAEQDHLVNPMSAIALAEKLKVPLVRLKGECGHVANACEVEKVKEAIHEFLN